LNNGGAYNHYKMSFQLNTDAVNNDLQRIDEGIVRIENEMNRLFHSAKEFFWEGHTPERIQKFKAEEQMNEKTLELLKVEKLILQSYSRTNNKQLFPIMFQRYSDNWVAFLDAYAEGVKMGVIDEERYLKISRTALEKRDNMKECCRLAVLARETL